MKLKSVLYEMSETCSGEALSFKVARTYDKKDGDKTGGTSFVFCLRIEGYTFAGGNVAAFWSHWDVGEPLKLKNMLAVGSSIQENADASKWKKRFLQQALGPSMEGLFYAQPVP